MTSLLPTSSPKNTGSNTIVFAARLVIVRLLKEIFMLQTFPPKIPIPDELLNINLYIV